MTVSPFMRRSFILVLGFWPVGPPVSVSLAAQMPEYDMTVHVDPSGPRLDVQGTMRVRLGSAERKVAQVTLSGIMHDVHIDIVRPEALAGPLVRAASSDTSS